ncbi:8-amino-7-oxononanoate synthase [Flavobacteriaceae bacterium MAR_2010_188]|nr:8-amino-7-oxononanoate synthase [Flavobacteriaceae bacterium MAR_2010_188]
MFPKSLQAKLDKRKNENAFRSLGTSHALVDFSSNDYLGFSKSETIYNSAQEILEKNELRLNGSTGSRLLTGNHSLYPIVEKQLCYFHESEACLIFNSGYDTNIGFFSSVPQRGDVILYDEFIHASIRDGISISKAKSFKFGHNNLEDLKLKSKRFQDVETIYVVTESVFSMDGDSPNLTEMAKICAEQNIFLVVDEAHAVGVFGKNGVGLVQDLNLQNKIFARIITFGKAIGAHGAAVLGSDKLKEYLVNFSRSLIYTTALPPHSLATISASYDSLNDISNLEKLHDNIKFFKFEITKNNLENLFIISDSAIHSCLISGNDKVKSVAKQIQEQGFNVKPILYPSVPSGQERLRFCIHSFNEKIQITKVLQTLSKLIQSK